MDPQTFGQRLRGARVAADLSQAEFSARIGIPKPTLSRYENDHVLPSISTLVRLADGLDTTVAKLVGTGRDLGSRLLEALRDRGVPVTSAADVERIADEIARRRKTRKAAG